MQKNFEMPTATAHGIVTSTTEKYNLVVTKDYGNTSHLAREGYRKRCGALRQKQYERERKTNH